MYTELSKDDSLKQGSTSSLELIREKGLNWITTWLQKGKSSLKGKIADSMHESVNSKRKWNKSTSAYSTIKGGVLKLKEQADDTKNQRLKQ
ncbi:hypothetical protein L6164_032990 [Bauhinia variegata]|uniref:Uncharacterized protein n=1 Tax=Bauhinia variegata TaxID=167791 RepID=A0ACB9KQH9_BAUVA|nr:hypothetical protein L6164_032990 [Bauhinia variegata]